MMKLNQLEQFLSDYLYFDAKLDVVKIDPYMTNGLMVRGKEEVQIIGFGVSASLSLFQKAHEASCDALLVHHSFNFPPYNHYDSIFQNRLAYLINHEISLFGYHFLLDAHPEVGNNVEILKAIGVEPREPYYEHDGVAWGWVGEFTSPVTLESIKQRLASYISPRTVSFDYGPDVIKHVATVSGKGAPGPSAMDNLKAKKIDLFITGEVHEWNRELFREAGINLIAGGHYATEVFGLKALMEKVQEKFPQIEVKFLDVYNDI